jgi:hypothetical protein
MIVGQYDRNDHADVDVHCEVHDASISEACECLVTVRCSMLASLSQDVCRVQTGQ